MSSRAAKGFSPRAFIRGRWSSWLDRRLPPQSQVVLNQKRIFILPSAMGMGYLLTTFLLFLAGVNYDNSLILNFSFFLGSLFVVSILQTFSNLSGLVITAGHTEPAFAGAEAKFVLHLSKSRRKDHHSIYCQWHGYESDPHNLIQAQETPVEMLLKTKKRGRYTPGRLKLHTVYPFGLCRAWTWVDLNMSTLVYPKPLECELSATSASSREQGSAMTPDGQEDFDSLRAYTPSDSLKTVDWKAYARRNDLYTKQFHGYESKTTWLRWKDMPSSDMEIRLSYLCYWVLQLSKTHEPYGLELPGSRVEPATGKSHEEQCLAQLAGFGHD